MPWVRSPQKPDCRMRTGKDSPLLMSRGWLEVTSMEATSIAVTRGVGRLVRDSLRVSMAAMAPEEPDHVSSELHDLEPGGVGSLGLGIGAARSSRRPPSGQRH